MYVVGGCCDKGLIDFREDVGKEDDRPFSVSTHDDPRPG